MNGQSNIPSARVLGILGSSRGGGNTDMLARAVFGQLRDAALIDFCNYKIAPYTYDHRDSADDFAKIARAMDEAAVIVFASPVYWYSMSAQMKIFFDRLTDLTETLKPIGKRLAGKHMFLISTGGGASGKAASFIEPFSKTAGYFKMHWGGALHASIDGAAPPTASLPTNVQADVDGFAARIKHTINSAHSCARARMRANL